MKKPNYQVLGSLAATGLALKSACLVWPALAVVLGVVVEKVAEKVAEEGVGHLHEKLEKLLKADGFDANHDLLRALLHAECMALAAVADETLRKDSQELSNDDARLLHDLRRLWLKQADDVGQFSVEDLQARATGLLGDIPEYLRGAGEAGVPWTGTPDQLRQRATEVVLASLRYHLRDHWIPLAFERRLRERWFDLMQAAFRERLKREPLARESFKLDVLARLEPVAAKVDILIKRLDGLHDEFSLQFAGMLGELKSLGERQEQGFDESRQRDEQLARMLEALLRQQAQQPKTVAEAEKPVLDFPAAFRAVAEQYRITPEEARQEVESWIAEVRSSSTDKSKLARAEFLAQHFSTAVKLSDEAATEKLALRHHAAAEVRRLTDEAVEDFIRAGEALQAQGDFAGALIRFERAAQEVSHADSPGQWAKLQVWLGVVHGDLGIQVAGVSSREHLQSAVAANQRALEIITSTLFPIEWAVIQNNLGNTLRDLAVRSEGVESVRLLSEAVNACEASLKVRTQKLFPQEWAMTQNNLGNALREQARRISGPDSIRLLGEAVKAYRAALEVRTRELSPQAWAMTQNNLANTLRDQAERIGLPDAASLLVEAVKIYRDVLEVNTRVSAPKAWAGNQNNLGLALRELAALCGDTEARRFLVDSERAYQAALIVFTLPQMPQDWATVQNNLGLTLIEQAKRSEGEEAFQMLDSAVRAFQAALEVRTRAQLPQGWATVQINLGCAFYEQASWCATGDAVQLLGESATAYRLALDVFTQRDFPYFHAAASHSLSAVEAELKKRQEGL
jgi:tetratricopeptide (TPR) repeat protein